MPLRSHGSRPCNDAMLTSNSTPHESPIATSLHSDITHRTWLNMDCCRHLQLRTQQPKTNSCHLCVSSLCLFLYLSYFVFVVILLDCILTTTMCITILCCLLPITIFSCATLRTWPYPLSVRQDMFSLPKPLMFKSTFTSWSVTVNAVVAGTFVSQVRCYPLPVTLEPAVGAGLPAAVLPDAEAPTFLTSNAVLSAAHEPSDRPS